MLDIEELLENKYKPEFPELLEPYEIRIIEESESGDAWDGSLCRVYEEGYTGNLTKEHDGYFIVSAVANSGESEANKYFPINRNVFNEFKSISRKCFPAVAEPLDHACVYLELREAWKELNPDPIATL